MTEKMQSQMQESEMKNFCEKLEMLQCLTKFVTPSFKNISTLSCYLSVLKDPSLDGLEMSAECLSNDFPSKLYVLE